MGLQTVLEIPVKALHPTEEPSERRHKSVLVVVPPRKLVDWAERVVAAVAPEL